MHLLLMRGTQDEFENAVERFGSCNTVLVTDRMTLVQKRSDGTHVEGVLQHEDQVDVSQLQDWKIKRDGDRLVVRVDGRPYSTMLPDPVTARFMNVGAGPGMFGGSRGVIATITI